MKKSKADLLSEIYAAYAVEMYQLNGNAFRQVSGSLYNTEYNSSDLKYESNDWLDERQQGLLKAVGEVLSPETQPITATNKIEIKSAISGKSLQYSFSFRLAFAFEILLKMSLREQRKLIFMTVQLNEKECSKLKTAGGFRGLQKKIKEQLSKPEIDSGFGFVVFEKTDKASFEGGETRYHFHAVCSIGNSGNEEKLLRVAMRRFSLNSPSSVQIIDKRHYRRFEGSERVIEEHGLDLGVADYLSKHIDLSLVDGVKNVFLLGIKRELNELHRIRFRQSRALKIVLSDLENELQFGHYRGDAQSRFEEAVVNFDKIKTSRSEAA